jgi:hypothetical protein
VSNTIVLRLRYVAATRNVIPFAAPLRMTIFRACSLAPSAPRRGSAQDDKGLYYALLRSHARKIVI